MQLKKEKNPVVRIGKTIRAVRLMKGLTQKDLAQRTGISQNHLSNMENGLREPGIVFLSKLTQIFDIPMDLFIVLALDPERLKGKEDSILQDFQRLFFSIVDDAKADTRQKN